MTKKTPISVIGTGYVGLCTALAFANKGFKIIVSDNDAEKVSKIRQGIAPFFEWYPRSARKCTSKG